MKINKIAATLRTKKSLGVIPIPGWQRTSQGTSFLILQALRLKINKCQKNLFIQRHVLKENFFK